MQVDFLFKVLALKTPQGFGLYLEQDSATGAVFLRSLNFNTISNFEFIDGVGCPPEPPVSGGLQTMDILMEVNGQPIQGLPLATVQGILIAQPVNVAVSLKWRRWSRFHPVTIPQQQQQQPQIVYNNASYGQASHIVIPGQQGQQIRRTYAVNYRYGFARELNSDELRNLANRSLFPLMVLVPIVIIAFIMRIYFMLFMLVIIFPTTYNYLFYKNKADELDRLDRVSPLYASPVSAPTQIVIAPSNPQQYGYAPQQQQQYVQQPTYVQPQQAYAAQAQPYNSAPVQAQAYPVYGAGYDNGANKSSI